MTPSGLSENYKAMLDAVFEPSAWKEEGNLKGLTALLCAYIAKDSAFLAAHGKLEAAVRLALRLMQKRKSDQQAVQIAQALVRNCTLCVLLPAPRYDTVV